MALYKTRQLLANYSQQSVRDLSVSRLEKLYAPVVAQRRQADLDNEQAFEMNIPHLEHVKHLLAQELEQMATEENAHMPVSSYFDAIQVAKAARVSENDIGCRTLITMLENTWKRDRTASLSAAKYVALTDHFRKNYPRSAVCEVLEKIGQSGYMVLECSRLAEIASDIGSQADYERVILENGLQSNSPNCKKARQFILALVNGDNERTFERTDEEDEDNYHLNTDEEREETLKLTREKEKGLDEENYNRDLKLRMRDKPFRSAQAFGAKEITFGFFIGVGSEGEMEANAEDDGWDLSTADSDVITDVAQTIEDNILNWLKKNVGHLRAEGHNSYDELAGTIWVEKGSEGHTFIKDAIEDGEPMSEGKGNLPCDPYEGIDSSMDKYVRLFNPSLDFMGDSAEEGDEETDTQDYSQKLSKKAQEDEEEFDSEMGRFDSPLAKDLWEKSQDSSWYDEEVGSTTDGPGTWAALFKEEKAILYTDSQGFISVDEFDDESSLMNHWEMLQKELDFDPFDEGEDEFGEDNEFVDEPGDEDLV